MRLAAVCFASVAGALTTSPLKREWAVLDRVSAASAATGQVAWRRLARELGTTSDELRQRWLDAGNSGYPVLPLLEPWEYADANVVRGVLDGATVEVQAKPGGDHTMSHGVFVARDGIVYEVGAPSETQLSAWVDKSGASKRVTLSAPFDAKDVALAASFPLALSAVALALGVFTHHLQIDIFVI